MTASPLQVRNMLRTYGRQLTRARRLARFRRSLALAGAEDEVAFSKEAKRRSLVERVAREIVENLLVSGAENPVVLEIKERLDAEFKQKFEFQYPPSELDMRIFRETEHGPGEVSTGEKNRILTRLWEITLEKVNDTML
ncbi:MAG: DVU0524 family FlgM-associated protein [Thermodesulfobacteriota bacterium]|nr:DVU0524 family FlgM-associated protein [Thermodesulfobacteriota bacterium]